jgi:hypothetical protein
MHHAHSSPLTPWNQTARSRPRGLTCLSLLACLFCLALLPQAASAIPLFNRQTGQNCVACHAGGQFPELTPYGRLFKLTGYTIGQRTIPVSAMALLSSSTVANTSKSDNPGADFQKNKSLILPTVSLFLGGKITDNIGAFSQFTADRYATRDDGSYYTQSSIDNVDIRFADRYINSERDLIFGLSANNNPSAADPWNTAAAWMQYVPVPSPTSSQFIDGATPYPGYGSDAPLAGLNGYVYWNQTVYGELGLYRSATGGARFLSLGVGHDSVIHLQGTAPYWRIALTQAWGAHNLMLGTAGMLAKVIDPADPANVDRFRDASLDAQYQYLLDPHAVTVQVVLARRRHSYPDAVAGQPSAFLDVNGNALPVSNSVDTTNVARIKASYVWHAKYGGSLAFFNQTGTANSLLQDSGFEGPASLSPDSTRVTGNLAGSPGITGHTVEAFYNPVQNIRLGAQYTAYSRFNGASSNYDGFGRDAKDNNSLFLYLWAAY